MNEKLHCFIHSYSIIQNLKKTFVALDTARRTQGEKDSDNILYPDPSIYVPLANMPRPNMYDSHPRRRTIKSPDQIKAELTKKTQSKLFCRIFA